MARYIIAMSGMLLMSLCIAHLRSRLRFPGSLYVYTRDTLPPVFAALGAWALFFAYVMTASSVIGGFLNSSYIFLGPLGPHVPPVLLAGHRRRSRVCHRLSRRQNLRAGHALDRSRPPYA